MRHWLTIRGVPVVLAYAALFVANGFMIGWRRAYDVSLGITSPAASPQPIFAWLLSVSGWLVAPGVAGAVAGYVVSNSIASRRMERLEDAFPRPDDE